MNDDKKIEKAESLSDINDMLNEINDKSSEVMATEKDFAQANIHRARRQRASKKKKRSKKLKVLITVLSVILGICVIIGSVWFVMYKIGEGKLIANDVKMNMNQNKVSTQTDDGKTIEYNGKKYTFNEDVVNILFMGVDKESLGDNNGVVGSGGQADTVILLSLDVKNNKYTVINISRDTYTDIGVYSTDGKYKGVEKHQLCLAYSYGDGMETSCENTKKAVSSLLFNIPITAYYSLERSAISILNDEIGGVTVPEFDENGKDTGKTKLLEGYEAYDYIHYRDISKLDSNNVRMKRQTAYLKAFASKFISETKQDLGVPVSFFNTSQQYSCTNLTVTDVTYLTTQIFSNRSDIKPVFKSIEGKVEKDETDGKAIFIPDEEKLTQLAIDTFYTPVS